MLSSGLCYGAIYKWQDADGKIHYSEQKPPEVDAKKMSVPTKPPASNSTYKRPSLKTKDDEKKAEGDKKTDKSAAGGDAAKQPAGMSEEARQGACEAARKAIETINSSGRVKLQENDGSVRYMGEDERQDRLKREQERVNEYCN